MPETITIQTIGSVAKVTLNRPDVRNAMSDQMVQELLGYFTSIREDRKIRVVILGAVGKTFCAGGDIKDLQAAVSMTQDERTARMRAFDEMLQAVNTAPQITIARIQGTALGGGFGLICVTDIAIAGESAQFGLPETQLGLSPALISPYVLNRIGLTRTRQLMLTGRRFGATEAVEYGLVHEACADDELASRIETTVNQVLECAPNALAETKQLLFYVQDKSLEESLDYRAALISRLRASEEGQQGMIAFMQKQKPDWVETYRQGAEAALSENTPSDKVL